MDANRELERKYLAPDANTLARLKQMLIESFAAEEQESREHEDTYFDTTYLTLLARGLSLRIRRRGGEYIAAVKIPVGGESAGGNRERLEYEVTVPGVDVRYCCELLVRYVPELTGHIELLEHVLTVQTIRTTLLVGSGGAVFEVALDEIAYSRNGLSAREYEVEIELKSMAEEANELSRLGQELEAMLPELELTDMSKYERGLAL